MNHGVPRKSTILIVDDNPHNIRILFTLLDKTGFEVRVAQDGETCLERVRLTSPDLILLDIMMPGMDGFETCTRLKANRVSNHIPIIFMTALSDRASRLNGLRLGAVDYITKPFDREEVLARVQLHLDLYYLTQKLKQEVREREDAEQALQHLNQQLEQRVEARTADLSRALSVLEQQKRHFQYVALHDALTGLPNRVWLMERLRQLIQKAKTDPLCLYAILFIDLDRFKVINDGLGHVFGDKLLKWVAVRLKKCINRCDTLVRFGGDEFIVLLEEAADLDRATAVARNIQAQFEKPFQLQNHEVYTDASIGIALKTLSDRKPEEILRDADVAMYHAKHQGRGRYQVLTPEIQEFSRSRLQLENDLRQAIERQELSLYYQPIVALATGQIVGWEALARWQHPHKGFISPDQFIPIAEETGMIHQLGEWVLQTALRQLSHWQQEFETHSPQSINVNLSPIQLMEANLPQRIDRLLLRYGLHPSLLKLEITESCLLEVDSKDARVLEEIKALGIQLCIDDFGTGYSALNRLHEFPLDTLKIDKSFVRCLNTGKQDGAIVQTILTLARSLGMEAIAEGIESEAQRYQLRTMGCLLGQGYLFARPLSSDRATEAIARAKTLPSAETIQ